MRKSQVRIEELEVRLRYALAALEAVEWIGQEHAVQHCPWCMTVNLSGRHAPDCQRQLVLQMLPLEVGEK